MSKITKKIIKGSLLFLFLSFVFISEIQAQQIKLLGGNNFSRYAFSPDTYMGIDWDTGIEFRIKSNLKNGLLIGLGLEFSLNKYLGFEMDILYSQKGCHSQVFRADIPDRTTDYSLNAISLPLLLKIKLKPVSSPYVLCGLECSYILSKSDFGYILGGGFEIKIQRITFFVEGRFYFGLKNIMSEPYPVESVNTKSEMLIFGFKL